jgi:hypothetical protein
MGRQIARAPTCKWEIIGRLAVDSNRSIAVVRVTGIGAELKGATSSGIFM